MWIEKNTPEDAQVAAVEIGYIGYYSNRRIVDPHGLLHRESLPFIKEEAWWWWYERFAPEVIVSKAWSPWYGEPQEDVWPEAEWNDFNARYEEGVRSGRMIVYLRRPTDDR